jgi:uncharacterized membrane protein YgaE (UPF0421/DUF939 family)
VDEERRTTPPRSARLRAGHDGLVRDQEAGDQGAGTSAGRRSGSRGRPGELGAEVARRGRSNIEGRVLRLKQRSFLICQVAIAAGLAWYIAHDLLGHPRAFFAPVAAIVSLGLSYGQRLRRVGEVTVGVAVGVAVADVFVRVAGTGVWQVTVVVLASMTVAVLLDSSALVVTQAAVQSVVVVTLLPAPSAGFSRWTDAVVGGAVALVAAAVAPQSPLRRPREEAAAALDELAAVLHDTVGAARADDLEAAEAALARARATDQALGDLRAAAAEGLSVVRSSPFRRRHRATIERVAELAEPIDRAVRNARVLVRRASAAVRFHEPVPADYLDLVEDLADVTGRLADALASRLQVADVRPDLDRVARESALVGRSESLSATVVLAQVRSILVDLYELTGLDADAAMGRVPRPA